MEDARIYQDVYIGLGTNLGQREENLHAALEQIERQIGLIHQTSLVYATPAMGFEGSDFLNMAIHCKSVFTAPTVLKKLLQIERGLGRKAKKSTGYENRIIDLDLLIYGDKIIDQADIKVPHPGIGKRNFVVYPLMDLLEESFVLPGSSDSLLDFSETMEKPDTVDISFVTIREKYVKLLSGVNFLAIEGNIGSGKTSLTKRIGEDFLAETIFERFEDNPFLPRFYEDQNRYAFPLEMLFLADRYQQLSDTLAQGNLFHSFKIADYYVVKSLIFSRITLAEEEYTLYARLFHMMYKELPKPDLYIYLHQSTERLLQNIEKRGRTYESNIRPEYLESIQDGYASYLKSQKNVRALTISMEDLDFMEKQEDYLTVLERVIESLP